MAWDRRIDPPTQIDRVDHGTILCSMPCVRALCGPGFWLLLLACNVGSLKGDARTEHVGGQIQAFNQSLSRQSAQPTKAQAHCDAMRRVPIAHQLPHPTRNRSYTQTGQPAARSSRQSNRTGQAPGETFPAQQQGQQRPRRHQAARGRGSGDSTAQSQRAAMSYNYLFKNIVIGDSGTCNVGD
jgi:hypothetical protein